MGIVPQSTAPLALEEISIRQGDLDLRLVHNRLNHHLRVMDFRVGNYHEKRDLLDRLAVREGLRKVFTIVEKSDSQSWRAVGFSREGCVPGFFRTADGYVMSRMYEGGQAIAGGTIKPPALDKQSYPRKKYRRPDGGTVQLVTDLARMTPMGTGSVTDLRLVPLVKALPGPDMAVRVKHRRDEYWVSVELDDSFGHGRLDLFAPRRGPNEGSIAAFAAQTMLAELEKHGSVTAYGLCGVDDAWTSDVWGSLGFKVTARLADHLANGQGYVHANIWHRRISGAGS